MPGPPPHIPAGGPGIRPRWGRRREGAAREAGGRRDGLGLGTPPERGSRVARATATARRAGVGPGDPAHLAGGRCRGGQRGCQPHGHAPQGPAPRPGAPRDEGRGRRRRVAPCPSRSPTVPLVAHDTAATAGSQPGWPARGVPQFPHTHTGRAAGPWWGRGVSPGFAPRALAAEPRGAMALDGVPAPDATSGGGSGVAGLQSQPCQRAAGNVFPSRRTGRLPERPRAGVSEGRACQHPARGAGGCGRRGGHGGDGTGVFPANKIWASLEEPGVSPQLRGQAPARPFHRGRAGGRRGRAVPVPAVPPQGAQGGVTAAAPGYSFTAGGDGG